MFAETLLESGTHSYAARAKATFYSFGMQVACVALLVALPVIFPMALPLVMPPSVKSVALIRDTETTKPTSTNKPSAGGSVSTSVIDVPRSVPKGLPKPEDSIGPAPTPPTEGLPFGPRGTGVKSSIDIVGEYVPAVAKRAEPQKPLKVSELQLGGLLNRVQPQYPAIAKPIRLQ